MRHPTHATRLTLRNTPPPRDSLLLRYCLVKNPFTLSVSKCAWIPVSRQAQHERASRSIRARSIASTTPRAQRGFVLAATLWMMAILTIAAMYFAQRIANARSLAEQASLHSQALLDMQADRAELLYRLATTPLSLYGLGDAPSTAIALDDRVYAGTHAGELRLQDDRGLLNLNVIDDVRLDRLLNILGAPADGRAALIDALRDYIDSDDLKHLNGAEAGEYAAAGLPPPRNANLVTPYEARSIYGWSAIPSLWKNDVLARLTTTSGSWSLNPNTAPWQILATLPGMTPEGAQAIIAARKVAPLTQATQIAALTGVAVSQDPFAPGVVTFPADSVRITQQAHGMQWGWQYNVTLTPVSDFAPWRIDYFYRVALPSSDENPPVALPLPARATRDAALTQGLPPPF